MPDIDDYWQDEYEDDELDTDEEADSLYLEIDSIELQIENLKIARDKLLDELVQLALK